MKNFLSMLALLCVFAAAAFTQQSSSTVSPELSELWRIHQQIEDLKFAGQDVPQALYDRFFELDRLINPDSYTRLEQNPLDELSDVCPGIQITGPDSGVVWTYYTNGQTTNKVNNCSAPTCRFGRDVFMCLEVLFKDSVTISTCGSSFDTYLCVWTAGCCSDPNAVPFASNDDNPTVCGSPLTLQAGITRCFDPGLYYICLDGSTPSAHGAYQISVAFHGNSCIYPDIEPECPADFRTHEESTPEGCDAFSNTVFCGEGYCGQIDQLGDLDVYALTVTGCERIVTVSVWADDTPGRTGFEQGLNSLLRVWPVTCEAPLAVNSDFNGDSEDEPIGTDSRLTISLVPGTYFFEVSGEDGTTGPYELFVSCTPCEQ